MDPRFDIYAALCLVGFSQAVLWALVLLQRSKRSYLPNQLLVSFLLLLAFAIGHFVLQRSNYILAMPHFAGIERPIFFLYAPALYLYIRAFLEPDFKPDLKDLLHLIPFLICAIWYTPLFLAPTAEKESYLMTVSQQAVLTEIPFSLFVLAQEGLYLGLIYQLYRKHRDTASGTRENRLNWVRNIIALFLIVSALYAAQLIFFHGEDKFYLLPLALSLFIYEFGFLGIREPGVFAAEEAPDLPPQKYAKSALSESQAASFAGKLEQLMDREQLFLDSNLSLATLADKLSISTNHLSQVLNQNLGGGFYEYVNRRRIAYASDLLLADNGRYVVEEIAFKAGFNSRSAFNTAFRKHTGTTPSEYRKSRKNV